MENENKDSLATQKVIELLEVLEQSGTDGQAELKEKLKQFLLGREKDCEMDVDVAEEKEEVEEATLYVRVGGRVCNTPGLIEHDFKWFVIPPRGVADTEGCICSIFEEPNPTAESPPGVRGRKYEPLAVGPYIFLISDVIDDESTHRRDVLYRNTQNKEEGWKDAKPLVGEHARVCHFIVADDKIIYAFGSVDSYDSLRVSSFNSQKPDQEWKVEANASNKGPSTPKGLFSNLCRVFAFTIQYDTTTIEEGQPGRRALHALLFADSFQIAYDFDDNSYVFSNKVLCWEPWCGVCTDGGKIYMLIQGLDVRASVSIKVYDYVEMKWGMTQVIGLDKYLPVAFEDYFHPPSRLVDLGNKRLCLVYALHHGADIHVHCTKFSVAVQQDGKCHATNVSSKVYKLNASTNYDFDVVAVCTSNEKNLKFGEDNAVGVESQSGKHNHEGQKMKNKKRKQKKRKV